jgi:hypothetical protein
VTRRRLLPSILAAGAGLALSLFGAASMSKPAAAGPAVSATGSAGFASARAAGPAPETTLITVPAGPGTGAPAVVAPTKRSARAKLAAVLGGLLLIGVLWAFSQGYGILGGHPRRRRMPPAASTSTSASASDEL